MPVINCYVDEATLKILRHMATQRQRDETPEMLAENAIASAARDCIHLMPRDFDTVDGQLTETK